MHIDWHLLVTGILGIICFISILTFYAIKKRRDMFDNGIIQLNIKEGTNKGTFQLLPIDRRYMIDRKRGRKAKERLHPEEEEDTHVYLAHRERAIDVDWPPMQPKFLKVPAKLIIHVEGHAMPVDPVSVVNGRMDDDILDFSKLLGQFADEKVMAMLVKIGNYVSQLEALVAKAIKPMHFMIAVLAILAAIAIVGYLVYKQGGNFDAMLQGIESIKDHLGVVDSTQP